MKENPTVLEPVPVAASWLRRHRRKIFLLLGGVVAAGVAISCGTVSRSLLAPPQIPGATFVGTETCEQCHEDIVRDFKTATHARLKAPGDNAKDIGCESCHGAGSLHNESGGARGTIINPRRSPDACFACHQDKRGTFNLPNHHPVIEGKVSCADCHDPHKGDAVIAGGTKMMSQNEVCGKCHTTQFGPFTFEHEALKEGCTTCHQPHGSVNQKMLITRGRALCLKCHFEQQSPGLAATAHNASASAGGTCWSAGCHEAIHGSQVYNRFRY